MSELPKMESGFVNSNLEFLSENVTSLMKLKFQSRKEKDTLIDDAVERLEGLFVRFQDKCLKENKAVYWFRLGQLYNISTKFRKQALEPLTKAVKLDPTLTDAWNELGENYWHNNETELAQKCFENALSHDRKVLPLRNLSIVMRKLAVERDEKLTYINKGIEYAKEAVNLDLKDGMSWGILGNSYLSAYFGYKQEIKYARLALSAYKQAGKLPTSMINSELHYNKAIASKYCEMYKEALISIDNSLEIEKDWQVPANLKTELIKYLKEINVHYATNGKLRPKKLKSMQKELEDLEASNSRETVIEHKIVSFTAIKEGKNEKVVIMGKVIWNLSQDGSFPFTFGFIDSSGKALVVTVYNMTLGKGFIIGDSVVVPEPLLINTNFEYENETYCFKSVRVENPIDLIVNKKKLPLSYFTAFSLLTRDKDEM